MPIQKTKDGKWKYGKKGKEYSSKKDAIKQGLAILYSQAKKEGKDKPEKEDVEKHLSSKEPKKGVEKKAANAPDSPSASVIIRDTYPKAFGFNDPKNYNEYNKEAPLGKYVPILDDPTVSDNLGIMQKLLQLRQDWLDSEGPAAQYEGKKVTPEAKKFIRDAKPLFEDWHVEREADKNPLGWDALKLRGPSYLGFALAGALVGRLIAGKRYRWWGYGLGALGGGLLNQMRRAHYYGTKF